MKSRKTVASRKHQVQVSISLSAELMRRIDAAADNVRRARSNFIARVLEKYLDGEIGTMKDRHQESPDLLSRP